MAKKESSFTNTSNPKTSEQDDLINYQRSLKKDLRTLSSCLSIIFIAIGLYLLVSGLFGLVNTKDKSVDILPFTDNEVVVNDEVVVDNNGKIISNTEEETANNGTIDEGGLFTQRVKAESSSAEIKAANTAEVINREHRWRATDYEKGEIGIGAYQVKLGDTLWEIAEAVYGEGREWKRILQDNKGEIGFLPNGSQALIIPGQVLKINK